MLILNVVWFAMGFYAFHVRRKIFAKVLVPSEHRDTPVFATLTETGRFLGGFNLAFSVLNIFLVFNLVEFDKNIQWAILLLVNALAHGTQFAGNVPMALQNRRGAGLWNVFKGVMLRIFVVDFILMIFNAVVSALFLLNVLSGNS